MMPMPPAIKTSRSALRTAEVELFGYGPSRNVSSEAWLANAFVMPVDFRTYRDTPAVVVLRLGGAWVAVTEVRVPVFSISSVLLMEVERLDPIDDVGAATLWPRLVRSAVETMENGWFSHGRRGLSVGK